MYSHGFLEKDNKDKKNTYGNVKVADICWKPQKVHSAS